MVCKLYLNETIQTKRKQKPTEDPDPSENWGKRLPSSCWPAPHRAHTPVLGISQIFWGNRQRKTGWTCRAWFFELHLKEIAGDWRKQSSNVTAFGDIHKISLKDMCITWATGRGWAVQESTGVRQQHGLSTQETWTAHPKDTRLQTGTHRCPGPPAEMRTHSVWDGM